MPDEAQPPAAEPNGLPGAAEPPVEGVAAELPPAPAPAPERYPFWGYSDLLLLAGVAVPCMLLGWAIVKAFLAAFHIRPPFPVLELLPEQSLGYAILFSALALIFRLQYDRPFWRSLAWTPVRLPVGIIIASGTMSAFAIAMFAHLIGTPTSSNAVTQLMQDSTSMILMAIFGTTIAPLSEELLFRGFLQPLLVRTLGVAGGILLGAIPFGFLHYHEYGNSWRHAVLISLAGAAFGWMRHVTGSTRASALMHAAYNGMIFLASFMQTVR